MQWTPIHGKVEPNPHQASLRSVEGGSAEDPKNAQSGSVTVPQVGKKCG